ncbi:lysylphosphatidylglycerol synthase transmembrane domain-containing protein [Rhodoflexus caldus]|uniref:lysylphosphatidylglycerol synthase transmembrane domain-containing protein n=1 Tax=Rhodoflexus caldus TaxID=2891236 RepID=UPI00202A73A0|nr:lysylphosphatidylglycerol synthase transmembrane domain-containing protein [Rhodoflexus caldus]
MKEKAISALKYILTLAIAIGLFWMLYRNQDFGELWRNLSQARWEWIAVSIILSLTAHLSRGIRWAIMLKPLGYNAGAVPAFIAVMIGYLANLVVPRMGEVSRSAVLQRMRGIPFQVSFGAVIAERVFDLFMLVLFTLGALWLEFDRLSDFLTQIFGGNAQGNALNKGLLLGGVALVALGGIAVAYATRSYWMQLMWAQKIIGFLKGLKDGVLSVLQLSTAQRIGFLLHTVVIWACYYLTSYVLFFAMPATEQLDWHCALAILMMSGISIVAPVQGGIGVYHLFVTATLSAYGIAQPPAQEFAFMAHSSQLLSYIVFGVLALGASLLFKPAAKNDKMAAS